MAELTEKRCLIVGAGGFYGYRLRPRPQDLVIAADGGYASLLSHGVRVDIVLGDFDSLDAPPCHAHVLTFPAEKDETDMQLAIDYGLSQGYRQFTLYGGTGGRIDHTMANLQCLAFLSQQGAQGVLYGKDFWATALTAGELRFPAACKGTISVFAHSDTAVGVTQTGLKYPLQNATLYNHTPLGVSNAFLGREARIRVESGTLLVMWQRQTIKGKRRETDDLLPVFSALTERSEKGPCV